MDMRVALLIFLVSTEGICGHGWGRDKLPFSAQAAGARNTLKCEQGRDKYCVTECPFKRPQPWKNILYAELVFDKDTCKLQRNYEKDKENPKCRTNIEDCFSDFPLECDTLPPVFTISMVLDISLPKNGRVRIFQWDHLTMDMEKLSNGQKEKLIFNSNYTTRDVQSLQKAFHIVILVNYTNGNMKIEKILIDDKTQKMSQHQGAAPLVDKTNTSSDLLRFGYKRNDRNNYKYMPLTGKIKSFAIFNKEMNESDHLMEKQFFHNLEDNVRYPECICQRETVTATTHCSNGLDRLTGSHSKSPTHHQSFVPVQAVGDGTLNDNYGFWLVNAGKLYVKLEKPSMITKLEIYMHEQGLTVSYVFSGIFMYLTCTGGLCDGIEPEDILVMENYTGYSFKKFTWTWNNTTAPLVTKSLHLIFDNNMTAAMRPDPSSGLSLNGNAIYEVILYGIPVDEAKKMRNCVCFPGNFQGNRQCDECGQCPCRAGNQTLAGKMCEPYITHLEPKRVYLSGGMKITVHGGLLMPFSHQTTPEVKIGKDRQCLVKNVSDFDITCVVDYSESLDNKLGETPVWVYIKKRHIPYFVKNKVWLNLTADPEIKNVTPYEVISWSPVNIAIEGTNLGYVEQISLAMIWRRPQGANLWKGECMLLKDDLVVCNGVIDEVQIPKGAESITVDLELQMDEIPAKNVTAELPHLGEFKVLIRPEITGLSKFANGELRAILKGKNLNNCQNYTITIGQHTCQVIHIREHEITCTLPREAQLGNKFTLGVRGCGIEIFRNHTITEEGNVVEIVCGILLPLSLIVVVTILLLRRKKKKKAQQEIQRRSLYQRLLETDSPTTEELLGLLPDDLRVRIDDTLIDESRLHMKSEIGKGNFGKVLDGVLTGDPDVDVAIKTLRDDEDVGTTELIEFLEEATTMKNFHHPNVLNLLGIAIIDGHVFVVLPLMENGDLKTYVSGRVLTTMENISILCDVASGMSYLAEQKFVHRDLAARNCMVHATGRVLIADFGLTRDIYEKEYYKPENRQRALPVKWMALESLLLRKFSSMSDVWAFGVVMWEVFSRGERPYPNIKNINIKTYLKRGFRLDTPADCPNEVSDLMKSCWRKLPNERPTFRFLLFELQNELKYCLDNTNNVLNASATKLSPSACSSGSITCRVGETTQSLNTTTTLVNLHQVAETDLHKENGPDDDIPIFSAPKPPPGGVNIRAYERILPSKDSKINKISLDDRDFQINPASASKTMNLHEATPDELSLEMNLMDFKPGPFDSHHHEMNPSTNHLCPGSASEWDPGEGTSNQHTTSLTCPFRIHQQQDDLMPKSPIDDGYLKPTKFPSCDDNSEKLMLASPKNCPLLRSSEGSSDILLVSRRCKTDNSLQRSDHDDRRFMPTASPTRDPKLQPIELATPKRFLPPNIRQCQINDFLNTNSSECNSHLQATGGTMDVGYLKPDCCPKSDSDDNQVKSNPCPEPISREYEYRFPQPTNKPSLANSQTSNAIADDYLQPSSNVMGDGSLDPTRSVCTRMNMHIQQPTRSVEDDGYLKPISGIREDVLCPVRPTATSFLQSNSKQLEEYLQPTPRGTMNDNILQSTDKAQDGDYLCPVSGASNDNKIEFVSTDEDNNSLQTNTSYRLREKLLQASTGQDDYLQPIPTTTDEDYLQPIRNVRNVDMLQHTSRTSGECVSYYKSVVNQDDDYLKPVSMSGEDDYLKPTVLLHGQVSGSGVDIEKGQMDSSAHKSSRKHEQKCESVKHDEDYELEECLSYKGEYSSWDSSSGSS